MSPQQIVIIDYGSGNLQSVAKAFKLASLDSKIKSEVIISADLNIIRKSNRIVLPGVGSFSDCRKNLDKIPEMIETLEYIKNQGKPILGICVGMQLLATYGFEFKITSGFNWIEGEVHKITPNDPSLKIPHIGWNTILIKTPHKLIEGIENGSHAYFVHSFHFVVENSNNIVAETNYGGKLAAVVVKDNIAGMQFHPEKSQALGLKLLTNFLRWKI